MSVFSTPKRARFLLGSAVTASASLFSWNVAEAAPQFDYKLAHTDTVDSPDHVRITEMAAAIKSETNGRVNFTIFPNSQLGAQESLLSQLRSGAIQFLFDLDATYSAVVPVTAITAVGFAFTSQAQPWAALDGRLGEYIRNEFTSKGVHAFQHVMEAGFREVTTSSKPIQTADDFNGLKVRTPPAQIFVDLFKALGASPTPISANEMYSACQTHLVDGVELPYLYVQLFKMFEVQKYLSVTNHIWGGYWLTANMDAWRAFPPDVQDVVSRNAAKYTLLERNDSVAQNRAVADKLRQEGLAFNSVDTKQLRPRLAAYYARWRSEFGQTAWSMLEEQAGKLG